METKRQRVVYVSGKLVVKITAPDGRSIPRLDISGPALITETKLRNGNTRALIQGQGRNLFSPENPVQACAFKRAGLPRYFFEEGPFTAVETVNAEGKTIRAKVRDIGKVTSVCTLLRHHHH